MYRKRYGMYFAICLGLFLIDRYIKYYVEAHIPVPSMGYGMFPYAGIEIFQGVFGGIDFSITHVTNTGAAWGFFARWHSVLFVLRIVLVTSLLGYLIFFNKESFKQLPFALIITGAIGNIWDDFLYGHVIDMFHFTFFGHSFAVFNIADCAIFLGVAAIMIYPWMKKTISRLQRGVIIQNESNTIQ